MSGVDSHAGPLGEVRIAGAANGVALTTTAAFTSLPRGTEYVSIIPRNAVTAVVYRYMLNPYLTVFKTTDALLTAAAITEASADVQDGDTATSIDLSSLGAAAAGDFVYIGSHVPIRGIRIIIGDTNSTASVMTVKYRKSDDTWADITATDGTASAGATFAQTGNITWTVPTDAIARSLQAISVTDAATVLAVALQPWFMVKPMYWYRIEVSVALDASVTVTGMQSMNRSTAYAELPVDVGDSFRIAQVPGGTGCIEALTDAGTANLLIRAATLGVGSNFI